MYKESRISVVIPCYKVENHISNVVNNLPDFIDFIILVHDHSPDNTIKNIHSLAADNSKIVICDHSKNKGVGGAMLTGFQKSIELNTDITIKLDGDNQMDSTYIPALLEPLIKQEADFSKGNRFKEYRTLNRMPVMRRLGNLGLSFLIKASSGYWNIFDPTNGFIAITNDKLKQINFDKIHNRYFFESSLLIELYHTEAVIKEIPMKSKYGNEVSNLSITKTLFEFPPKLIWAFFKRIIFKYFLFDFNIASIYLMCGIPLFLLGTIYGLINFIKYSKLNESAPTGTVVIPTLLITLGFQLLLSAINYDITNYPQKK